MSLATCHVDDDIQAAHRFSGTADQGFAECLVFQVTGDGFSDNAFRLDKGHDFSRIRFFLGQMIDDDVSPFPRESDGHSTPDATIAARDKSAASLQPAAAFVRAFSMVGGRIELCGKPWSRLLRCMKRRPWEPGGRIDQDGGVRHARVSGT